MNSTDRFTCRKARLDEIYALRLAVLRPGHPALDFAGDKASPPLTWHFGAFVADSNSAGPEGGVEGGVGKNVACLTLLNSTFEGAVALQLRGMAVTEKYRGQGAGSKLLSTAEEALHPQSHIRLWWCNAREQAVRFYARAGWRVVGQRFNIEAVGPHFRMMKEW